MSNQTLKAYQLIEHPMLLKGGTKKRLWMDETPNQFAYRCLPLSIANTWGWDIVPQQSFIVSWDGNNDKESLQVHCDGDKPSNADSQFGHGILTFLPGYLFKTPPGYGLMVTGPINNDIYDWATFLTGIVETDWLEFTFTLNWRLNHPGNFLIRKNYPIGRIIPFELQPEWKLEHGTEPEVFRKFQQLAEERTLARYQLEQSYKRNSDFGKVKQNIPSTEWDKKYYRGIDSNGEKVYNHISKVKFPDLPPRKN